MPASIDDYFRNLLDQINLSPIVHTSDLNFDKRSSTVGFIRGQIFFNNGSILHLRELIDMRKSPAQVIYVYHYQNSMGTLIFRYDNTPHHTEITSFPHHKHTIIGTEAILVKPPDLSGILSEIESRIE
jgi:hypothetical protein